MSQILTKPVFLDETGQDIAGKLDDIKDAIISSSGEFVPLLIKVTTPPTKTNYLAGETLDLTGMVVTLIGSNGASYEVTPVCTFSPADGATLASGTTKVDISYTYPKDSLTFTASQSIVVKELSSIAVTTPPTQTEYMESDELDLTGIVVTATYDNGSTAVVTSECTFSPDDGDILSTSDTAITVTYTEGSVTKTATQAITVSIPIYGVEWDGTASSALTRTDAAANFADPVPYYSGMTGTPSSPFDNIMPWSGMRIVEDASAGTLVEIPKFWYKLTKDGNKIKVQISPVAQEGFSVSPAHMNRGDGTGERDFIYVGRYHCDTAGNQTATKTYKSTSGITIGAIYQNRSGPRYYIHQIGTDVWLWDMATLFTIQMLYLVEFADWNSQAKIGTGAGNPTGATALAFTTGYTDSMPYHTGTTQSSRSTQGRGVQYRHLEGLWEGSMGCFVDGMRVGTSKKYLFINPSEFSDTEGGTELGYYDFSTASGGDIANRVNVNTSVFPILCPYSMNVVTNGDEYVCDRMEIGSLPSYLVISGNGNGDNGAAVYRAGLFALRGVSESGSSSAYLTCRLMKLPNS